MQNNVRRYFIQVSEREIKRAREYGESFSTALLDLDHFNQINDQYGHLMEGRVLRELSAVLKEDIRHTDVFARDGGDEFIFLLLQANGQ